MKNPVWLVLLLAVLLLLYFYNSRSPEKKSGKMAPNFVENLKDGSSFELAQLKGRYVLLDFWGSWCPPCRRDNPNLVQLYKEFHASQYKDASGFDIVSIALEKNEKTWSKTIRKDGLDWPYHILHTSRMVATDPLARKYNVTDLPTKFLIGPDGDIVGVNMTRQEIESYLRSKLGKE